MRSPSTLVSPRAFGRRRQGLCRVLVQTANPDTAWTVPELVDRVASFLGRNILYNATELEGSGKPG